MTRDGGYATHMIAHVSAVAHVPDDLDVRGARYDVDAASLLLNLRADGSTARRVEISIANVWNRGDWTLHLDNERVGRGTSVTQGGSNAVAMQRDSDTLVIECPLSRDADLRMTWH